MNPYRFLMRYRLWISILPALAGVGTMIYYATCTTSCSYLRGDILGIDLKYVGVTYMAAIILLALIRQADLLRMVVAAGIGVEVFLVSFQVQENVFCPYCLTFGIMVILIYLINYERISMVSKWYQKIIYVFGDAQIPFTGGRRIPLLLMMLIGYVFIVFSFSGSATPAYAAEDSAAPSYGQGSWELIVFTDYFCEPCQELEKDLEPELERLLSAGSLKITFVDYPGHKGSGLYAKYFVAAVASGKGWSNALKARNILFSQARQKKIDQEKVLVAFLTSKKIALNVIDPKPVFNEWTTLIKRHEIDQTPTCVLRYSGTYAKKYVDSEHILKELIPELQKRFSKK